MEQILIQIPEGHVIDTEKSNLEEGKIVFKKKESAAWKNGHNRMDGYFILDSAEVMPLPTTYCAFSDDPQDNNVFATEKQARSSLAMAQLSQIIENDKRFGGPITAEEWNTPKVDKYCIVRESNDIHKHVLLYTYCFVAFHTQEQRDLFLNENEDLIRQYFMLD